MTTRWHKSTHSGGNGCVQVARPGGAVHVRDSKNPASPVLTFDPGQWRTFIDAVKGGRL
jgi:hypothetical protein